MYTPAIALCLPLVIAALLAAVHRRPICASWLTALASLGVAGAALSMVNLTREEGIDSWRPGGMGFTFVFDSASAVLVLLAALITAAVALYSSR